MSPLLEPGAWLQCWGNFQWDQQKSRAEPHLQDSGSLGGERRGRAEKRPSQGLQCRWALSVYQVQRQGPAALRCAHTVLCLCSWEVSVAGQLYLASCRRGPRTHLGPTKETRGIWQLGAPWGALSSWPLPFPWVHSRFPSPSSPPGFLAPESQSRVLCRGGTLLNIL